MDTRMLTLCLLYRPRIRVVSYQSITEPIDNIIVPDDMLSMTVWPLVNKLSLKVEFFISRVGCVSIMSLKFSETEVASTYIVHKFFDVRF